MDFLESHLPWEKQLAYLLKLSPTLPSPIFPPSPQPLSLYVFSSKHGISV